MVREHRIASWLRRLAIVSALPVLFACVLTVDCEPQRSVAIAQPAPEPPPQPTPDPSPEPTPATITLILPDAIRGKVGEFVYLVAETNGREVVWVGLTPGLQVLPSGVLRNPVAAIVMADKPGAYQVLAYTARGDKPSQPVTATVQIGDAPEPPTPDPAPEPPAPTPPPIPVPSLGLRVLIVEETSQRHLLPPAQLIALSSPQVAAYMNSHCAKGADGRTPEWRKLDPEANLKFESQFWRDGMKRERKSLPWIVVTNGKDGYEGPLPPDTASVLDLLKKFGGP